MATILLVDDDQGIVKVVSRRLKKAGHTLHIAEDGRQGIEKAWERRPDLILMDMHMPVMDGHEAVRTLREQGYTGKIAALTASADLDNIHRTRQSGCDAFIAKPFGKDFESKISEILSAEG